MTATQRDTAPLYARISQELGREISDGRYPQGALMPPELELCAKYGVSRITMRAAMEELRRNGLISRRAGVGTRVEARTPRDVFVHESDSVESILHFTDQLEFRLIETHRITAQRSAAEWLGCATGARLVLLRGLRVGQSGPPVALSAHHVPETDAAFARRAHGQKGSIATRIEAETGRRIATIRQTIEPVALGAREASLLQAGEGDPALMTWRWHLDDRDVLLLASNSLFPRGRYVWSQTVRRRIAPPELAPVLSAKEPR
ncbi:MAG TPA: GntR family transcriptional regulator [Beijerinckiaceae bacterium]|nr:GntR family transcriptional regulator [Beijerinckiaceae bacterium]